MLKQYDINVYKILKFSQSVIMMKETRMNNHHSKTAIIIGGDISGLCAAVALKQAGLTPLVFDRNDMQPHYDVPLFLFVNALNALEHLGLADSVRSLGVPARRGKIRSWRGDDLFKMSAGGAGKRYGAPSFVVHRADLRETLLAELGSEYIRPHAQFIGFEQNVAGVTAWFADGSMVRGDVLIGADGLRSRVRGQLFGHKPPRYAGYTSWRAVTHIGHTDFVPGIGFESWGYGQRFGLVPLRGGYVFWFAMRNELEGLWATPHCWKRHLLDAFHDWHAPIEAVISATDETDIVHTDIYDRAPLPHWSVGAVTLLGDAAHPMTPDLGQGACQAIEDAVVLAECLHSNTDVLTALQQYDTRRLQRVNKIVLQSRWLGRISQLSNPLAVGLRDTVLRWVPSRAQAQQLGWIWRYQM
jgi:2-polyprenyl-6-methoxyphenol hydroxylase-like FAD-dependent oxidoreductase